MVVAKREDLRRVRAGSIINVHSSKMESELIKALEKTVLLLDSEFEIELVHEPRIFLRDIVGDLRRDYPDVKFDYLFDTSFLLPDGGILYLKARDGTKRVVLISEAKRQGTNDLREAEGLKRQAKGNAIERLGKNVTGFRTWLRGEAIFPFVVFGQGVDFDTDSSILDRVTTIAMFAPLNTSEVHNVGENGMFNRGSFYFRASEWEVDEMAGIMYEIAKRSIYYYFAKYGDDSF